MNFCVKHIYFGSGEMNSYFGKIIITDWGVLFLICAKTVFFLLQTIL